MTSLFLPERDAHGGGHQRRGIIDAVAEKESFRFPGFFADDGQLVPRAFPGVDFRDAHLLGQVTHLGFAVARDGA